MAKYRNAHYREICPSPSQTFSEFKKDYRLDERNNVLVETGTLTNIQELIQSAVESTFDKKLDKLMPTQQPVVTDSVVLNTMQDKLALMSEAYNVAESYREKYKLADDLTPMQIFDYVTNEANKLKESINKVSLSHQKAKLKSDIEKMQAQLDSMESVDNG